MVKWTPELDAVLLIKVLEACEVKPNAQQYQEMAATWPDHLERPTDRAISEHLFVIRKKAKATINASKTKNDKGDKANGTNGEKGTPEKATPKKRAPRAPKDKTATPEKAAKSTNKRKRVAEDDDDSSSPSDNVTLAPKREPSPTSPTSPSKPFPMPTKKSRPTEEDFPMPTQRSRSKLVAEEVFDGGMMYDGSFDNPIKVEEVI